MLSTIICLCCKLKSVSSDDESIPDSIPSKIDDESMDESFDEIPMKVIPRKDPAFERWVLNFI